MLLVLLVHSIFIEIIDKTKKRKTSTFTKQVSDKVRIINLIHPRVILLMDVYGLKR